MIRIFLIILLSLFSFKTAFSKILILSCKENNEGMPVSLKFDLENEYYLANHKIPAAITDENIFVTIENRKVNDFFIYKIDRYTGSGYLYVYDIDEVYKIDKNKVFQERLKVNIEFPVMGSEDKPLRGENPVEQRDRRNLVIAQHNTIVNENITAKYKHFMQCEKQEDKKF